MNNEMMIAWPRSGEKQEEKFPGPLDVPQEMIRCEAAGAAIGHLHARDEHLLQSVDPRTVCDPHPAGSRGQPHDHRGLDRRRARAHAAINAVSPFTVPEVEMGSFNLGSINMFDGVYQNRYEDIAFYARKLREAGIVPTMPIFDLSHLINYQRLVEDGELRPPYVFEFVFDVPYALPYTDRYLDLFVDHLPARCHLVLCAPSSERRCRFAPRDGARRTHPDWVRGQSLS